MPTSKGEFLRAAFPKNWLEPKWIFN
jgi:hypothetical protein